MKHSVAILVLFALISTFISYVQGQYQYGGYGGHYGGGGGYHGGYRHHGGGRWRRSISDGELTEIEGELASDKRTSSHYGGGTHYKSEEVTREKRTPNHYGGGYYGGGGYGGGGYGGGGYGGYGGGYHGGRWY